MFGQNYSPPQNRLVIIRQFVKHIKGVTNTLSFKGNRNKVVSVEWSFPLYGWVKLNTRGASKGNLRDDGSGGLIRSDSGSWIVGFTYHMGFCSAFIAELWGILKGLLLAWHHGFRKIRFESDSCAIITILIRNGAYLSYNPLLRRLGNICADWLV